MNRREAASSVDNPASQRRGLIIELDHVNQLEAFAPKQHVFAEAAVAFEERPMHTPPMIEREIASALKRREFRIHITESPADKFERLQHRARASAAVAHNGPTTNTHVLCLRSGPAGRGLTARQDQLEQLVSDGRTVAERKTRKLLPIFGHILFAASRQIHVTLIFVRKMAIGFHPAAARRAYDFSEAVMFGR